MGMAKPVPVCACCYTDLRGDEDTPWLRGHEPEWLRALQAALADANERAEAEANRANVAGARLVVARADYGVLIAPARSRLESLLYGEGQDDVPDGLDALLTAAADEIEHSRALELEATVEREARRCLAEVERERDTAIARADALATLCKASLDTMRYARVFVSSRQQMHPHGVELWDALAARLAEVEGRT